LAAKALTFLPSAACWALNFLGLDLGGRHERRQLDIQRGLFDRQLARAGLGGLSQRSRGLAGQDLVPGQLEPKRDDLSVAGREGVGVADLLQLLAGGIFGDVALDGAIDLAGHGRSSPCRLR
jgi:hypothetical protein